MSNVVMFTKPRRGTYRCCEYVITYNADTNAWDYEAHIDLGATSTHIHGTQPSGIAAEKEIEHRVDTMMQAIASSHDNIHHLPRRD